jgi:MFS family permease
MFFVPINAQMANQNPVLKLMNDSPAYRLFNQGAVVLGLLATIVLLAAGVGLLIQKPFGRQLSIGYGIYGIIAVILGLIVNVLVVFPVLIKQYNELPPGPEQAGAMGGIIGGVVGTILGLIYPALVLYFMYTPKVIAAYSSDRAP